MEAVQTLKKLKNPASIVGAILLVFLGIYIASSSQFSIGNKNDPSKTTELSRPVRLTIGIVIFVLGMIIMITHLKKQQE